MHTHVHAYTVRHTAYVLCTLTGPLTTCKKCPHVLTFTSFSFVPSSLQERWRNEIFQLNSVHAGQAIYESSVSHRNMLLLMLLFHLSFFFHFNACKHLIHDSCVLTEVSINNVYMHDTSLCKCMYMHAYMNTCYSWSLAGTPCYSKSVTVFNWTFLGTSVRQI